MHRGGGNSLKPSHNQDFSLIEAFNNLALWGEKKFVSELKRTYKFQRGVNRHTEGNSLKYRMVDNIVGLESPTYSCNGHSELNSGSINVDKRLRNKCAMTCFGNMNQNIFNDKDFSRFTSHFSLKSAAFTLAEVLVTLGIIGVVSAMTVPTLMQNYQRQSYITQLHKVYNEVQQGALRYMTDRNAINLMEAGLTNSAAMQEFLRDNFKIVSMGTTDSDMPWNNVSYKNLNGGSWTSGTWGCGPCAVLASGAWVCADNPKCYTYSYGGHTSWYGMFFVDINGKKGPNIIGRDTFLMELWSDGVLDLPKVSPACRTLGVCDGDSIEAIRNTGTACEGSTTYTHQRCFANILNNNWEMNY